MSEGNTTAAETRKPIASPVEVTPPAGFVAQALHDPFEALMGPLFERVEPDGSRVSAFVADERHLHADGYVHEGMMMTFADAFLGGAAWRGSGDKPCVTMSLQASFLADVARGATIECRTKVEKKTRSVMFVSASFTVAGEQVMTATSLWKVLGER
ncbi:MAG: PaaI family thioesterase [Parvibaculum sp.]|nr:PaaI family thioesterase [Parvibaculum sp.]|tara:strand:- start:194 stop:661 length:468 start_codon:yes stop_codon:yes gene_type:complete